MHTPSVSVKPFAGNLFQVRLLTGARLANKASIKKGTKVTETPSKWWKKSIVFKTGPITWTFDWAVIGYMLFLGVLFVIAPTR